MENYYRLTKKELSFISSTQKPIVSTDFTRLSKPVVIVTYIPNNTITRVYSLKWFKKLVKENRLCTELFKYDIYTMF